MPSKTEETKSAIRPVRHLPRGRAMPIAVRHAIGRSALGPVLVAATPSGICAVLPGTDAEALVADLRRRLPRALIGQRDELPAGWLAKVEACIADPARGLDLPLDPQGSDFERRVWRALCAIPAGRTISYAELAGRLGAPRAARAVARACAANPIAVAVPCHRVRRGDGGLGGYRWGIEVKRALLAAEAA